MADDKQLTDVLGTKGFTIIINGRECEVETDEVSFDYVVDKAYPDGGRGELISYTVPIL